LGFLLVRLIEKVPGRSLIVCIPVEGGTGSPFSGSSFRGVECRKVSRGASDYAQYHNVTRFANPAKAAAVSVAETRSSWTSN